MIISDSKCFIFVHIPKTGGTSLSEILMPYRLWKERSVLGRFARRAFGGYSFSAHTHAPIVAAKHRLGRERFGRMLKFAIVRHPVDWHFSMFRWILRWRGTRLNAPVFADAIAIKSFGDYLDWRVRHGVFPQLTQLVDFDGRLLVDRICRLENLDAEVGAVLEELGITATLPRRNVNTVHLAPPTSKERDFAMSLCEEDCNAFGYSESGLSGSCYLAESRCFPRAAQMLTTAGGTAFDPWRV